ncbi:LLM class flavin-dependent oxidoreductase [Nonomuraea insulae]|uniref:LLM class flavin-dependent oxidoreductase n=1 Tax=Nonomuraea insulae TaxID=1616787 RepID=A0ABW1CTB6_9ACTN
MARFGYFLACEEHGPNELVRQAKLAEQAGFEGLWISDHYHPWTDTQGQSPFVWTVIGALAEATRLPITTAVTCPLVRIHPAVVAQAAATAAVLSRGRFRLGVGTGEALNELALAGRIGDGYICTGPAADLVRTFHESGGQGKVVQGGIKVCYAADEASARKTAHRIWPTEGIQGEASQLLPLPRHFEQLAGMVSEEEATRSVPCGPDPEVHARALREYVDAGFDEIYVCQIGPEQEAFFDFYAEQVLPLVR